MIKRKFVTFISSIFFLLISTSAQAIEAGMSAFDPYVSVGASGAYSYNHGQSSHGFAIDADLTGHFLIFAASLNLRYLRHKKKNSCGPVFELALSSVHLPLYLGIGIGYLGGDTKGKIKNLKVGIQFNLAKDPDITPILRPYIRVNSFNGDTIWDFGVAILFAFVKT